MATDSILVTKLSTGQTVRVGDMGKTVIKPMPAEAENADSYEPYFFYGRVVDDSNAGYIGEINDIQVEPTAQPTDDNVKAGQTIVYNSGDLL